MRREIPAMPRRASDASAHAFRRASPKRSVRRRRAGWHGSYKVPQPLAKKKKGRAAARPFFNSARDAHLLLEMRADQLGHLEHRDLLLAAEDGQKLFVGIDHRALLRILQIMLLDVLPQFLR